jgi:hypothetical protein
MRTLDIQGECYCIDITLKLSEFEVNYDTICFYRFNEKAMTYSVFMQYAICPYSRITGEVNMPLYHQYNLSIDKFKKHFSTKAEWRQEQIDSIINEY